MDPRFNQPFTAAEKAAIKTHPLVAILASAISRSVFRALQNPMARLMLQMDPRNVLEPAVQHGIATAGAILLHADKVGPVTADFDLVAESRAWIAGQKPEIESVAEFYESQVYEPGIENFEADTDRIVDEYRAQKMDPATETDALLESLGATVADREPVATLDPETLDDERSALDAELDAFLASLGSMGCGPDSDGIDEDAIRDLEREYEDADDDEDGLDW